MTIELTAEELAGADWVARARQRENLLLGRGDKHGAPKDRGLDIHICGARGEHAVAKMLRVAWDGSLGDLSAADVGGVQVRTTRHKKGSLILHPEDPDDLYYLVIDRSPEFDIYGPIRGSDGKQSRFWRDPTGKGRPAYFVPQWFIQQKASDSA